MGRALAAPPARAPPVTHPHALPTAEPARSSQPPQVGELARLRGETCIGYISEEGDVHLVPASAAALQFPKSARLVVLSEN